MDHSAQQVCEVLATMLLDSHNTGRNFTTVDGSNDYTPESLIFVSDKAAITDTSPAVIVTTAELFKEIVSSPQTDNSPAVLAVSNVRLAQALVKQAFADYCASDPEWPEIHPSAVIHPSVSLGLNVRVGPNSVIGANTVIGNDCQIRANCVIEHDAIIGANCVIHNLVNIGYDCVLGDRVIVRPGAVIGNEGFGLAADDNNHYHRIPHTGTVEIADDVQIGSNCNIDRGTYGATRIAKGVKLDALCHVAHNVVIDEHSLLVAQSGVAGSSKIGKHVLASGQTGVLDHRTVADNAVLVHRCGVTEDIPHDGMWAGTPPRPFKEYVRNVNLAKKVARLEQQLKELKKRST